MAGTSPAMTSRELRRTRGRRSDNRSRLKPSRDVIELLEVAIADREDALAAGAMRNAHREPQRIGQSLLQCRGIRIATDASRAPHLARLPLSICARHLFNLTHVQAALHDQLGELL